MLRKLWYFHRNFSREEDKEGWLDMGTNFSQLVEYSSRSMPPFEGIERAFETYAPPSSRNEIFERANS